jgi:outer membrane translocation and assembly module TamA
VNLEFRVPIYYDIDTVLFGDMGVLSQGGFGAIQPHDVVGGIGFGLRYQTPIGPVRFDIGWKLKDFDLLRNHAWFLTLGHAF